jgi:flagellar assembly protein FliH
LFNVIKGGFVNKEAKPIVIKPKGKNKNHSQNQYSEEEHDEHLPIEDNILPDDYQHENLNHMEATQHVRVEKEEDEFQGFEIDEELLAKREELEELQREIDHLKLKAEQDARDIIEQAKFKAEIEVNSIKAEAWDIGHNEGYEAAKNQILLNSSNIFANVQNVMEEALKQKDIILEESKDEIMSTVFKIAEKIIKKELNDKEILKNNLSQAFNLISTTKKVTVYINWEQLEIAEELKEELSSKFYAIEEFNIIEDKNLLPGGCVIETKMGRIDASIETQLAALEDGLKD